MHAIRNGAYGYQHVNVADQRRDPNSLMDWMERMIRVRKETPEIGWGDFRIIDTGCNEVLAIRYDWRNNHTLVLHNFSADPVDLRLAPHTIGDGAEEGAPLINILSKNHSFLEEEEDGRYSIQLEPYGYRWFRVGGFDGRLLKMAQRPPSTTSSQP